MNLATGQWPVARKIGARRYIECSAKKDPQSCHAVFEAAVREALKKKEAVREVLKKKSVKSSSAPPCFSCFNKDSSQQDDQR